MNNLKTILFLSVFSALCGCQKNESSNQQSPTKESPPPFQVTITTVTLLDSGKGAEKQTPNPKQFSNLEDVQNHLNTLNWQSGNKRYEIEIVKLGNTSPDVSLHISNSESNPETTEFRYYPDSNNKDDFTRINLSKRLNGKAVVKMVEQAFEQLKLTQTEDAG